MGLIWEGLQDSIRLLMEMDPSVLDATVRSLWITSTAVLLAALIGLPLGTLLARVPFFSRNLVVVVMRASMAFPTVFIGIVCYAIFSRRGPLGSFEMLYTPWAIVIGEFILALPMIVSITHGAVASLDSRVAETVFTLGAGPLRRCSTYMSEARVGVSLAVLTAFSRCVTELGIAMMVGGNIKERTRTLATATALETSRGEFARGLAMGLILLAIAMGISLIMAILTNEPRGKDLK